MNIWLINHYAVPPNYYPLARPYLFAKNLISLGHEVTIIAASTVHNSNMNLINGKQKYRKEYVDGIRYIYIKCVNYNGNGIKRIINILEYAIKLNKICAMFEKPDVIISTSFDPISCYQGIKIAKKYGITVVAEIADLWPETLVAYTKMSKNNILVKFLRMIEKKIYVNADSIIFTVAGAYDYIIEQGWQKDIPKNKVFYINNGIDIEQFNNNKKNYVVFDTDLDNNDIFKVIYTGSIRKVNNLGKVIDVAKNIKNEKVKFLIWGDGNELLILKKRLQEEKIDNVVFKGKIDKKYIPYITSKADLNYAHNKSTELFKYGISFNKIFDYLAAGKPILCDFFSNYNPVIMGKAGVVANADDVKDIAKKIEEFVDMDKKEYNIYCEHAKETAGEYDFKLLTQKLLCIINRKIDF